MNSFDLLSALKKAGYLSESAPRLWWPNAGSFEVLISAILTQQTKWSNVELSLANLKKHSLLSLEDLADTDEYLLQTLIQPSGFARQKSSRLIALSRNIIEDFGSFEALQQSVEREWLLAQKGLGRESADAILCYACLKPVMVQDSYTARLLAHYGYEFESYEQMQEWFYDGVLSEWDRVLELYGQDIDEHTVWARFHGKIVEFCKQNINKNTIIKDILEIS
ncbi:MAG: 3-methyladenine DNA glycosylase [Campylobacteraceae bacterium]|jgi:endonuclease-3 related protein|nr:3-methyladenine DNA glycosylase [Campylobacteraceae bacterium]